MTKKHLTSHELRMKELGTQLQRDGEILLLPNAQKTKIILCPSPDYVEDVFEEFHALMAEYNVAERSQSPEEYEISIDGSSILIVIQALLDLGDTLGHQDNKIIKKWFHQETRGRSRIHEDDAARSRAHRRRDKDKKQELGHKLQECQAENVRLRTLLQEHQIPHD